MGWTRGSARMRMSGSSARASWAHALRPAAKGVKHSLSGLRRQIDVIHEQRVDAGLAESDDCVIRRADNRLAVVERRIDDDRHAGLLKKAGNELVKTGI